MEFLIQVLNWRLMEANRADSIHTLMGWYYAMSGTCLPKEEIKFNHRF